MAQDYDTVCKIRAYVIALESSESLTDEVIGWVEWAKEKADWYAPTIARKDESLGKREHEKGIDLKLRIGGGNIF